MHEQPQHTTTNHNINSTMTGFQLALALEGSLHNNFQRGISKPIWDTTQQPGQGDTQNSLSSKQIATTKIKSKSTMY